MWSIPKSKQTSLPSSFWRVAAAGGAAGIFVVDADLSRQYNTVSLGKDVLFALVRPSSNGPHGGAGAGGIRSTRGIAYGEIVVRSAGPAVRGLYLVDGFHEQRADRGDAADHEDGPHLGPEKQVRSLIWSE